MNPKKNETDKHESLKIDDDQLKKVTGGTTGCSFDDFFASKDFDKELVDDGTKTKG